MTATRLLHPYTTMPLFPLQTQEQNGLLQLMEDDVTWGEG